MKHLIGILALLGLVSCHKDNRWMILSEGLQNDTLFVERCNFEEYIMARGDNSAYQQQVDTLLFVDGRVEITWPNDEVQLVTLQSPDYRDCSHGRPFYHPAGRIGLLVQPGEAIEVRLKPHKYGHLTAKITGSELNAEIAKLDNQVRSVQVDMYATGFALNEALATKSTAVDSLRNRVMNIRSALHSVYAEYVKAHPEQEVSAYCFFQMGPQRGERYYRQIEPKVFKGVFRPVKEAAERYFEEQSQRAEMKAQIEEGAQAPDFALKDPKGKSVTLSSHRGKWVVLDFWGTWCSWCIKGMPHMKKVYEQYADRMEIIGVACGDKIETWRTAVDKMQLPWVNVIDPKEAAIQESVAARYAVEGYPTKVVITPEGTIHKIFKGESKEFYEELKTLFE